MSGDLEVLNVQIGHPRYEDLLGQIRGDDRLLEDTREPDRITDHERRSR